MQDLTRAAQLLHKLREADSPLEFAVELLRHATGASKAAGVVIDSKGDRHVCVQGLSHKDQNGALEGERLQQEFAVIEEFSGADGARGWLAVEPSSTELSQRDARALTRSLAGLLSTETRFGARSAEANQSLHLKMAEEMGELLDELDHSVRGQMNLLALSLSAMDLGYSRDGEESGLGIQRLNRIPRTVSNYLKHATDFSHSLLDTNPLTEEHLDLAELTERIEQGLAPLTRTLQIELVLEGERSGQFLVDPRVFAECVNALLQSSLRCSPPNSVVRGTWKFAPDDLILDVKDAGPPIPAELCERMLRPMSKRPGLTDGSDADVQRTLAWVFARRLGGELRCLPNDGQGAHFQLCWPRKKRIK